jgi:WD40-like Beta Propeller Repeat
MLSNASGGRTATLDSGVLLGMSAWSPDGQWVAFERRKAGAVQLAKVKPGSAAGPEILFNMAPAIREPGYQRMQWSPAGDWFLYPTLAEGAGLSLISPDGHTTRSLTSRRFIDYGFSKDGSQVVGIYRNTKPDEAEWQLYSVDIKSGAEKLLGAVDLPPATEAMAGFSLHPDGKSFLISVAKWPDDIWMLEGFDQNKSWLDRLLRR